MEKQKLLLSHLVKAISFRILERSRLKEYSSLGIEVNTVLESRRTILEDFINNKRSLKTHLVLNSLLSPKPPLYHSLLNPHNNFEVKKMLLSSPKEGIEAEKLVSQRVNGRTLIFTQTD